MSAGSKLVRPVNLLRTVFIFHGPESHRRVTSFGHCHCNFPALLGATVELEANMTSVAPGFGKSNIVVIFLWISQKDESHTVRLHDTTELLG